MIYLLVETDAGERVFRVRNSLRHHRRVGCFTWRLWAGAERICFLQLRFNRGAPYRRRRRQLRAQLLPFLFSMPPSMDFGGVQTSTHDDAPRRDSGEPDVLAPRPFWPLAQIERDRLTFSKIVEGGLLTGGIVKEILDAIARQNETEALVANEPLDCAVL